MVYTLHDLRGAYPGLFVVPGKSTVFTSREGERLYAFPFAELWVVTVF